MSKASNLRRTARSRKAKIRPTKYKVYRGFWRTKAQTREILGLRPSDPVPRYICKLPDAALRMLKAATSARMEAEQQAAA